MRLDELIILVQLAYLADVAFASYDFRSMSEAPPNTWLRGGVGGPSSLALCLSAVVRAPTPLPPPGGFRSLQDCLKVSGVAYRRLGDR